MKKLFTSIVLSIISISNIVSAEPYPRNGYVPKFQVKWEFSSTMCEGGNCAKPEDYSTNLGIPIALALPHGLIHQGWACVRLPIEETPAAEYGYFKCANSKTSQQSLARCSLSERDNNYTWMTLTWINEKNEEVNLTLRSKCTNTQIR